MANVKVFADRQTDKQAKNYMPPIFQYGGIILVFNTYITIANAIVLYQNTSRPYFHERLCSKYRYNYLLSVV
jgi:hypothetical protein